MKIILDLDSTVISSLRPRNHQPTGLVGYNMDDEFIVYERPHLQEFLSFLFDNYEVGVWTAASKDYAIFIVEKILLKDPKRKLSFLLFDYHGDISEIDHQCPKDLTMVWENFPSYTKENTVIIDDYEAVYIPQMCNSYPIPPFHADAVNASSDQELLKLRAKLAISHPGECPNEKLMTSTTVQKALMKAAIAEAEEEAEKGMSNLIDMNHEDLPEDAIA